MVREFVDRVFDGAPDSLLLHLAKDNTLTPKQRRVDRETHRRRSRSERWTRLTLSNLVAYCAAGRRCVIALGHCALARCCASTRPAVRYVLLAGACSRLCLLLPLLQGRQAPRRRRRDDGTVDSQHRGDASAPAADGPSGDWPAALAPSLARRCRRAARSGSAVSLGRLRRLRRRGERGAGVRSITPSCRRLIGVRSRHPVRGRDCASR